MYIVTRFVVAIILMAALFSFTGAQSMPKPNTLLDPPLGPRLYACSDEQMEELVFDSGYVLWLMVFIEAVQNWTTWDVDPDPFDYIQWREDIWDGTPLCKGAVQLTRAVDAYYADMVILSLLPSHTGRDTDRMMRRLEEIDKVEEKAGPLWKWIEKHNAENDD